MWKLLMPVAAVATGFSGPKQHLDFEAMAANFRSISEKQSHGETIDQATFDQVKNFIYQISTLVKGALDTDEEYAQSIYNKSVVDVEACDTTRQEALDGAVKNATDAANAADAAWETCKDEEQIEYDNMTEHCDDVDAYVNDWNINGEHCAAVDFSQGDSQAVEDYMICICKFVEDHKDIYYEKRQNCTDATADHADKKQECCNPGLQGDMDDAYCAEQAAIQQMCHDYAQCRDREEGELAGIKATVEKWEDVMQAQRVALEQLICFGNHILDNNTDLGGCDDLSHTDCTKYTDCPMIVYHDPAARVPCSEPNVNRLPCTDEYKQTHHWHFNGTDTPPSPCKDTCTTNYPFVNYDAPSGGGLADTEGIAGAGKNWCSDLSWAKADQTDAECKQLCGTWARSIWGTQKTDGCPTCTPSCYCGDSCSGTVQTGATTAVGHV